MLKVIAIKDLKTRPPFKGLFPIDPEIRSAIKDSMRENGIDQSKPIDVWKEEGVIVDGHTRYEVAEDLEIGKVLIFEHSFTNESAALAYAIANQKNRRNIAPERILACVAAVDQRLKPGTRTDLGSNEPRLEESKRSADHTAALLGVSPATVKRVRAVIDHADPATRKAVEKGELTLNQAYQEVQEKQSALKEQQKEYSIFNRTNDNIEWASWSWNPVTGCEHACLYCYARDIANRFYKEKFKPTFHPERLTAPKNMGDPPVSSVKKIGDKNVFVCSMADLFGSWVSKDWIDQVIQVCRENPKWNFLFLTKNPKRYLEFEFPKNAWLGTTVSIQKHVAIAEKVFRDLEAEVKWLSCEPLLEHLEFTDLKVFDWIIFGGASQSTKTSEFNPPWEWIEDLMIQARKAKCMVYWKPNLKSRPKEYPYFDKVEVPNKVPKEFWG